MLRDTQKSMQVIGVDKDYKIPLIFYENEAGFKHIGMEQKQYIVKNSLRDILVPHIMIRNCENGDNISFRQLANYYRERRIISEVSLKKDFIIVLVFCEGNSDNALKKVNDIQELKQYDKIIVKIVAEREANKNKDSFIINDDINKFKKYFENPKIDDVIIFRSDSMIIGTLKQ